MLLNIFDYHCRKMSFNVATFAIILSLHAFFYKEPVCKELHVEGRNI